MNYIWNKNIALLKKRFPSLYKIYEQQIIIFQNEYSQNLEKLEFWKLSETKNQQITATENGKLLHSSYNPQREAQSICNNILNFSNIIFLGFGLGYHIIESSKFIIQNNLIEKKLIIIENDLFHFFGSLCILDWEDVFKINNLIIALACPIDQIIPLIENQNEITTANSGISDSYIYINPLFTMHSQNYFDSIKTLIERNKTKNEINSQTFKKFSKLWIRNSITNLNQIKKLRTVNDFLKQETQFLNQDYILVAAGPSLQKTLPHLKKLHSQYKIICVETALRALLNFQIEPDFIIITDPQYYAFRHILGLKSFQSILIAPISVHPAVFRFECKEIILCSDFTPVGNFFEKELGQFGDLGAGGSVASCAWSFAKLCNSNNVYLAGLDLSYPQRQTHIKGSSSEEKILSIGNRITSIDKITYSNIYSGNPQYSVDYENNKVLTDSRMKMFAWWFESKISCCSELTTFTLNKSSMKIPGVKTIEIEKLLQSVKDKNFSKETKLNTVNFKSEQFDLQFEKTKNLFFQEYNKIIQNINKAIELCIIKDSDLQNRLDEILKSLFESKLSDLIKYSYTKNQDQLQSFTQMKKNLYISD